jgi:hypothetical protein
MFVNCIPFFLSIFKNIRFIIAEVLDNRKLGSLVNALRRIDGIYRKGGFRITNILGDGEFECTRGAVATDIRSELHIWSEDEHVPDIERCIRTTKERTRCTYNSMPIRHHPPRLIIEMVFLSIFWLNAFPHRLGVSQTLSPRTIITGLHIDYTKHCRVAFGQYVQTHEKHNHSMEARTVGALALRPTGNAQGRYYFYSLMSGQRIHRTCWTELLMPAEVQDRVHALARRANATHGLTFTDSAGRDLDTLFPASNDDDNSDYDPNQDNQASYASSEDSNYDINAAHPYADSTHADVDDPNFNPGLPAHTPAAIAGVDGNNTTADPGKTPVVDDETTGVDDETTRVDKEHDKEHDEANLEAYVNELKAELDEETLPSTATTTQSTPHPILTLMIMSPQWAKTKSMKSMPTPYENRQMRTMIWRTRKTATMNTSLTKATTPQYQDCVEIELTVSNTSRVVTVTDHYQPLRDHTNSVAASIKPT